MICKNYDRQKWIDATKGFGILLVILGHTFNINSLLCKVIYSFHMPMFFIISGFLFNSKKYSNMKLFQYVKIKFKSYLIPYFIYSFVNLLLQIIWKLIFYRQLISLNDVLDYLLAIFYCYAGENKMPNCSSVRFLMCLFWSSIFLWFLCKFVRKVAFIFILFSLCASYCIYLFLDFRLPFNLSSAFMAVVFMWIGLLLREHNTVYIISSLKLRYYVIILIMMILLGLMASYFNDMVGMNENIYGNLLLFLISSISLSFSVMFFSYRIRVFRNKYFLFLGKNTMLIIGFNFIVRDFITEMYYFLSINKIIPLNWILSFILTTIAFTIIIYFYNKIKGFYKKRSYVK